MENVISDRGSRYAVAGGPAASPEEAKAFVKALCRNKKFARATHNTWGLLLESGPIKNDDGESGAGLVTATATAKGVLTGLDIDPSIFDPNEKEVVEDLILAAINDAQTKAAAKAASEMQELTEGMGLPAGMKLPF